MARLINNVDAIMSRIITNGFSEMRKSDEPIDPREMEYFTIEAIEDGCRAYFIHMSLDGEQRGPLTISYSKDKTNWTEVESTEPKLNSDEYDTWFDITPFIELNKGDKLYLKGNNEYYSILNDLNPLFASKIFCRSAEWDNKWTPVPGNLDPLERKPCYNLSGNIMSLFYGDDFVGKTKFPGDHYGQLAATFGGAEISVPGVNNKIKLFNDGLVSTKDLVLPATSLTDSCYFGLFCYSSSLTTAIDELPATTLKMYCYATMFAVCQSLVSAPKLPAESLSSACYLRMFVRNILLTTAPELPATELADGCYMGMFEGCTSLNNISVNFTDYNYLEDPEEVPSTYQWLIEVSSTGTFTCPEGLPNNRGISFIPTNWERVNK